MTVVIDTTELHDEQLELELIKEWIIDNYQYRGTFDHNPAISYCENVRFDVEELIDFLNENFCLNGYVWELNNNRLEYNEEFIR